MLFRSNDTATTEIYTSVHTLSLHDALPIFVARRDPEGVEQLSLYPGHVVIRCDTPTGAIELALGSSSLMGFQSWLESGPPGAQHL